MRVLIRFLAMLVAATPQAVAAPRSVAPTEAHAAVNEGLYRTFLGDRVGLRNILWLRDNWSTVELTVADPAWTTEQWLDYLDEAVCPQLVHNDWPSEIGLLVMGFEARRAGWDDLLTSATCVDGKVDRSTGWGPAK